MALISETNHSAIHLSENFAATDTEIVDLDPNYDGSAVINCANPRSTMDASICPLSAAVIPVTDKILLPLVTAVGIVGNILNLMTLTRKEMRSSTSKTLQLLIIMSSNDLALLLLQIPQFLTHYAVGVKTYYPFYFVYFRYPFSNILLTCNVWLTVVITIERCVAFTKHKRLHRCAKRTCQSIAAQAIQSGKRVGFVLLASSTVWNFPKFFDMHVARISTGVANGNATGAGVNNSSSAGWHYGLTEFGANPTYQKLMFWCTALLVTIIPMVMLIVFTTVLVFRINQHRVRKERLTNFTGYTNQAEATTYDFDASASASASVRLDTMADAHIGGKYVVCVREPLARGSRSVRGSSLETATICNSEEHLSLSESPLPLIPVSDALRSYVGMGIGIGKSVQAKVQVQVHVHEPVETRRRSRCYVPNTITILVVCIVMVFILTDWLAFYLVSMIAIFGRDAVMRLDSIQAIRYISNLLVVTNSSINFILFCSTSKKYRTIFLRRLCSTTRLRLNLAGATVRTAR